MLKEPGNYNGDSKMQRPDYSLKAKVTGLLLWVWKQQNVHVKKKVALRLTLKYLDWATGHMKAILVRAGLGNMVGA